MYEMLQRKRKPSSPSRKTENTYSNLGVLQRMPPKKKKEKKKVLEEEKGEIIKHEIKTETPIEKLKRYNSEIGDNSEIIKEWKEGTSGVNCHGYSIYQDDKHGIPGDEFLQMYKNGELKGKCYSLFFTDGRLDHSGIYKESEWVLCHLLIEHGIIQTYDDGTNLFGYTHRFNLPSDSEKLDAHLKDTKAKFLKLVNDPKEKETVKEQVISEINLDLDQLYDNASDIREVFREMIPHVSDSNWRKYRLDVMEREKFVKQINATYKAKEQKEQKLKEEYPDDFE